MELLSEIGGVLGGAARCCPRSWATSSSSCWRWCSGAGSCACWAGAGRRCAAPWPSATRARCGARRRRGHLDPGAVPALGRLHRLAAPARLPACARRLHRPGHLRLHGRGARRRAGRRHRPRSSCIRSTPRSPPRRSRPARASAADDAVAMPRSAPRSCRRSTTTPRASAWSRWTGRPWSPAGRGRDRLGPGRAVVARDALGHARHRAGRWSRSGCPRPRRSRAALGDRAERLPQLLARQHLGYSLFRVVTGSCWGRWSASRWAMRWGSRAGSGAGSTRSWNSCGRCRRWR